MKKSKQLAKGNSYPSRTGTTAHFDDTVMDRTRNERQKTVLLNTLRAYRVYDLNRTCQKTESLVARVKELCEIRASVLKRFPSLRELKKKMPEDRERPKAS